MNSRLTIFPFCTGCGLPNREGRMRGGEYLKGHEFPWLANVRLKDKVSVNGVLINNKYIITAASPLIGWVNLKKHIH